MNSITHSTPKLLRSIVCWFDAHASYETRTEDSEDKVDLVRVLPFIFLHLGVLGIFWVGWSWTAVVVAAVLYLVRMFAITGFYHRYFSHKTFKTSRFFQLVFAVLGNAAAQRGPLWWAAHHRHHHRHSDQPEDLHSPHTKGFLWSHIGWITARSNFPTRLDNVRDLRRFPELMFLDRFDNLVPILMAAALFGLGELMRVVLPGLGTSGAQLVIWGFFVSTVLLFHGTCTINSLSHVFGKKRYQTSDESRNNFLLALITLGEGWHNNHHHFPAATRQGFFWWEIDITYYVLRTLSAFGIIWDMRVVPEHVRTAERL